MDEYDECSYSDNEDCEPPNQTETVHQEPTLKRRANGMQLTIFYHSFVGNMRPNKIKKKKTDPVQHKHELKQSNLLSKIKHPLGHTCGCGNLQKIDYLEAEHIFHEWYVACTTLN